MKDFLSFLGITFTVIGIVLILFFASTFFLWAFWNKVLIGLLAINIPYLPFKLAFITMGLWKCLFGPPFKQSNKKDD